MSKRRQRARPCPTSTKTPFTDAEAAEAALERIQHEHAELGHRSPVRSYRCPCGRWHLTSRAA